MVAQTASPDEEARQPQRTDEQIVGALVGDRASGLQISLGEDKFSVLPLTVKAARTWKLSVGPRVGAAAAFVPVLDEIEFDTNEGLAALLATGEEDLLALIVEYDALSRHPNRLTVEWLEEHATGVQIREALEVLLDSVYPPMPGFTIKPGRLLLATLLAGTAARAASDASTSNSSTGTRGSGARKGSKSG